MNSCTFLIQLITFTLPLFVFMVVIARHPVFSLLFLIISFLLSTLLLFLLECELLALLFVIVYVGAIAILFLFAVMMLESKLENLSRNSMKYVPIGTFFGFLFTIPILRQIFIHFDVVNDSNYFYYNAYQNWYDLTDSINDVEVYGHVLYTYYVFQFLISGFILLLVLIGVVYLTNVFKLKQTKNQESFKQLSRNSKLFTNF